MSSARKPPAERTAFRHFLTIPTRWMDNDVYGHVNNAVYYSYFDTVINRYLIDEGGLDPDDPANLSDLEIELVRETGRHGNARG